MIPTGNEHAFYLLLTKLTVNNNDTTSSSYSYSLEFSMENQETSPVAVMNEMNKWRILGGKGMEI